MGGMRGTRHDVSLGSRFGVCVRDLLRPSRRKHCGMMSLLVSLFWGLCEVFAEAFLQQALRYDVSLCHCFGVCVRYLLKHSCSKH